MLEVYPSVWVGSQVDYEEGIKFTPEGWAVVHACKDPYHRALLGYKVGGAPKDHPEYLVARRDNRLFLNMIDVDDPKWVQKPIIDATMMFVTAHLQFGEKVLIHCNQGGSRAPSLAMLYLATQMKVIPGATLEDAEKAFVRLYPLYKPKNGIRLWLKSNWSSYINTPLKG